jgi:hypothetical protein
MCASSICSQEQLTRFLKASHGNWRDSFYIECGRCERACAIRCHDLLFVIDDAATPIIVPIQDASNLWQDDIQKDECLGVMNVHVFHELYKNWILGHIRDPYLCPLTDIHLDESTDQTEKMGTFVNL